jgi:hypothetical protein
MNLPSDKELKEFEKWHKAAPSHIEHGLQDTFDNPLGAQLKPGNPRNWRMKGNMLYCDTDFGPMAQTMPTSHILVGEENGLPVFRKVL